MSQHFTVIKTKTKETKNGNNDTQQESVPSSVFTKNLLKKQKPNGDSSLARGWRQLAKTRRWDIRRFHTQASVLSVGRLQLSGFLRGRGWNNSSSVRPLILKKKKKYCSFFFQSVHVGIVSEPTAAKRRECSGLLGRMSWRVNRTLPP